MYCFVVDDGKIWIRSLKAGLPGRQHPAVGVVNSGERLFNYVEVLSMATERNEQRKGSSNRGFGAMDPERQREIASQGGRAAHQQGKAHEFTSEEARAAGRRSHETG